MCPTPLGLALLLVLTYPATPTSVEGVASERDMSREKRQTADPRLAGYIAQALVDANAELEQQKNLDRMMLEQGKLDT